MVLESLEESSPLDFSTGSELSDFFCFFVLSSLSPLSNSFFFFTGEDESETDTKVLHLSGGWSKSWTRVACIRANLVTKHKKFWDGTKDNIEVVSTAVVSLLGI